MSSSANAQIDARTIARIEAAIITCRRCPELRAYCADVARKKKREHLDSEYWGKPVPAFGDRNARLVLVGLAPGAHGSNRTGRMFTGDASGIWLYRALHRAGFANQAVQRDRHDGLALRDVLITSAIRCAPPQNKPTPTQIVRCAPYLRRELAALANLKVIVGLGAIGTRAAYQALTALGYAFEGRPIFRHGAEAPALRSGASPVTLLATYHPSRQNTNTRKLTEPMLDAIFYRARALLAI